MGGKKWLVGLVIVLVVCLLAAGGVAAADGPGEDEPVTGELPTLPDAVRMVAGGAATGFVLAFLFKEFPQFQGLSSEQKRWLVFGISVGLPVVAQLVLQVVPAEVWAALEPYWRAVATGFLVWAGSQAAYRGLLRE